MTTCHTDERAASTAAPAFERRPERNGLVSLRVSNAERRELERLARKRKSTISCILRAGLAHARRLHADAATVCGEG
jgi:hypothetical protein